MFIIDENPLDGNSNENKNSYCIDYVAQYVK